MPRPSIPLRIAGPQQTQSVHLTPPEISMSLYENSTVEAIMPRILFTSSQLVSLSLNPSFYVCSLIFPHPLSDACSQKSPLLTTPSPLRRQSGVQPPVCTRPPSPFFNSSHCSPFSDKQHIRHCICLDELYPHPDMVDFILRPELSVQKKVLDIGRLSCWYPW